MMRRRLLSFLFLPLLIAGCGERGEDPAVREEERRLGAEQHPALLAEFGGAYRGPEAAYAARIGEKVASAAGLSGTCTFTLVNSDVVNAFAVPGCYIYVTRGLMALVNSEAELASVLAHEVGHIVGAHSRRQQKRSLLRSLGVVAVGLVTGSERLTQIAGATAQLFTLRYSRSQEYEADRLGISYLAASGYDPHEAADMLGALGRQEAFLSRVQGRDEARAMPEWVRTHPLTASRIEEAAAAARATGHADDALAEEAEPFLRELDGLVYGDDPEQGFVRGRTFAHPGLRIAFEAPPGFTLVNMPAMILLQGPDGMSGQFAGGRLGAGGLEAYLESLVAPLRQQGRVRIGAARPVSVAGSDALIVTGLAETAQGPVEFAVAAIGSGEESAFHFLVAGPAGTETAALSLASSFRRLGPAEAAALRPRLIRTVRVGSGQDARFFAARMDADESLALFRMLNGLGDEAEPRPGALVKIVTFAR